MMTDKISVFLSCNILVCFLSIMTILLQDINYNILAIALWCLGMCAFWGRKDE